MSVFLIKDVNSPSGFEAERDASDYEPVERARVCAVNAFPSPINVLKISLSEGSAAKSELQKVHNARGLLGGERSASSG